MFLMRMGNGYYLLRHHDMLSRYAVASGEYGKNIISDDETLNYGLLLWFQATVT